MKMRFTLILAVLTLMFADGAAAQRRLVRILITTPDIENSVYRPMADVMAEALLREFKRVGGMELIDRKSGEKLLKDQGLKGFVSDRQTALNAGRKLEADIVIFSTLRHSYDSINYTLAFLEVDRDVIQRTIVGSYRDSSSPAEVERAMNLEAEKLVKYVPMPSEIGNFGSTIREESATYDNLPPSSVIEDIPRVNQFGYLEQIFSYYRTFPGESEYTKLQKQQYVQKLQTRADMDEELTNVLNTFYMYGEFALRNNLQAYMIKDCSVRAFNVLLANKIPVIYIDGVVIGYEGLSADGFCMYKTLDGQTLETLDLTHRKRIAVLFVVPKPGKKHGISKSYLERAVAYYKDEWGKTPELVEIKDSMFDIISSGLE